MRINIYSQELTSDCEVVEKTSNTGRRYSAIRLYFHSSPLLHHTPEDDDRSAVTFWLPRSPERRQSFASTLRAMAQMIEDAPAEGSEAAAR